MISNPPVVPVGPSPLVKAVIRPLTKVLNAPIGKLAGRRHFPMVAQIHHVGRRSGKSYLTPVGVRVDGDVAMIPLTFGNQSDWARNIRAAGTCGLRANGTTYCGARPHFVDSTDAAPRTAFSAIERGLFRMLGIKQYMRLELVQS